MKVFICAEYFVDNTAEHHAGKNYPRTVASNTALYDIVLVSAKFIFHL